MSIYGLIDQTVMEHLSLFGNIKRMDPMAIHMLKNSENPLMRYRRTWMRREALKQCLDAHKDQEKRNKELASHPHPKGMNMRLADSMSPWLAGEMQQRHKTDFNDKDFLGYVKRDDPAIFPKRD